MAGLYLARRYGAVGNGVTDDTASLQAAIDACHDQGGGTVVLDNRNYLISGDVFVKRQVNLWGQSGGKHALTRITCDSDGRIRFGDGTNQHDRGGVSGNFCIRSLGGGDPTGIFASLLSVQRTFFGIQVQGADGIGARIEESQNCTFIGFDVEDSAGDNLLIDQGAGGNAFMRCELYGAGGYGLHIVETTGDGPYLTPQHNSFYHCIFEHGGSGAKGLVRIEAGQRLAFDNCVFSSGGNTFGGRGGVTPPPTALIDVESAEMTLRNAVFQGASSTDDLTGLYAKSATIMLDGRTQVVNIEQGFAIDTGCLGSWGYVTYASVGSRGALLNGANTNSLRHTINAPLQITLDGIFSTGINVIRSGSGETQPRWNLSHLGVVGWGSGSAGADVNLYRSAADILATDDDFEVTSNAKGVILKSPDGSRFRLTVSNAGALSATAL